VLVFYGTTKDNAVHAVLVHVSRVQEGRGTRTRTWRLSCAFLRSDDQMLRQSRVFPVHGTTARRDCAQAMARALYLQLLYRHCFFLYLIMAYRIRYLAICTHMS